MPMVGIATLLSVLGIMGAPFFNASVSKYMIVHGTYEYPIILLLNLVNLGTVMSFVKYSTMLFGNPKKGLKPKIKNSAQITALLLGFGSLITGVLAIPMSEFLLNYEFTINIAEYNTKNLVFIFMVIAGIGFYNGTIKHGGILEHVGQIELTFNGIITAMVTYLITVIFFTTLFI